MLLLILLIFSIILLVVFTTRYNVHAFFSLLTVAIFFALFAGMPLPEIVTSIEEGFEHVSYMSYLFKRETGLTPVQYRNKIKK